VPECVHSYLFSMAWSSGSSSCSPADELSTSPRPGGAKRRSITEMSQSARMTPQSQRERGLGCPWMQSYGLCAVDVQSGDIDEARQFCLLPTPELQEKREISPRSPEIHSPSSMQRRFVDLVHRASLGEASHSNGTSPSGVPGSPEIKSRRRSLLVSLFDSTPEKVSSVSPMHVSSPMSETTPTLEVGALSRQFAACSSAAPSRIPFLHRLDERLSSARNDRVVDSVPTLGSVAQKEQRGLIVRSIGAFSQPSDAIFEDDIPSRRRADGKSYTRPRKNLEKPRTGCKENDRTVDALRGKSEQKKKQAIVKGNGNLKALAKQAKVDAMVKTIAGRIAAKVRV